MKPEDMTIKARVFVVGRTMKDLCAAINEQGVTCTPSQLSNALTGRLTAPKTAQVIRAAVNALEEWERGGK